ncbi:VPS37 C-terminal domain-containing protein [Podarcis lilfordi]|uniref:VPS37 C-terminal domain-containing protein n=1 Tax=Podarcis lilfordi TaxID=74358 RepID=A0AA35PCI1_9SAUR|nr:VPS37 C-terminal domain-containing protein [Podarcis lilfordi]
MGGREGETKSATPAMHTGLAVARPSGEVRRAVATGHAGCRRGAGIALRLFKRERPRSGSSPACSLPNARKRRRRHLPEERTAPHAERREREAGLAGTRRRRQPQRDDVRGKLPLLLPPGRPAHKAITSSPRAAQLHLSTRRAGFGLSSLFAEGGGKEEEEESGGAGRLQLSANRADVGGGSRQWVPSSDDAGGGRSRLQGTVSCSLRRRRRRKVGGLRGVCCGGWRARPGVGRAAPAEQGRKGPVSLCPARCAKRRMNWLFPLSKAGSGGGAAASSSPSPSSAGGTALPPTLTSLQQQKQRQIESLRSAHAAIAEIQKDVEYRLPFTVNNLTININILLPPQFPQEKPVISVFPPIRHHLMDKQGVYVACPLISNFTMHSDLGKIVQSVLDEFWKNPPVLAPSSTSFPYLYNKPAGIPPYAQNFPFLSPYLPQETNRSITSVPLAESLSSGYAADRPAAPSFGMISDLPLPVPTAETISQGSPNGFSYKMPDVPDAFPELLELSISQLTDMNEQEDVLLEQFVSLPQLKQVINDKDDLVKSIEELASKTSEYL